MSAWLDVLLTPRILYGSKSTADKICRTKTRTRTTTNEMLNFFSSISLPLGNLDRRISICIRQKYKTRDWCKIQEPLYLVLDHWQKHWKTKGPISFKQPGLAFMSYTTKKVRFGRESVPALAFHEISHRSSYHHFASPAVQHFSSFYLENSRARDLCFTPTSSSLPVFRY